MSPSKLTGRGGRCRPPGPVVVLLLISCAVSCCYAAEPKLIGWLGEKSPQKLRGAAKTGRPAEDLSASTENDRNLPPHSRYADNVEQISWKPKAYVFHNFLSQDECEHLIAKATPRMEKSTVVDSSTGKSMDSEIRTSSGMFFARGEDAVVTRIEQRIAEWTLIPVVNGEGIQVLHYKKGQKYESHFDYFHDEWNRDPAKGGQRIATVLMYLSDVESGGETVFPASAAKPHAGDDAYSACGRNGVSVRPKRGEALFFYSLTNDGGEDTSSLHAGCPVVKGDKWSATKWMHVSAFGGAGAGRSRKHAGECVDESPECPGWAASGECERNAAFMVGTADDGDCLLSCKRCVPKDAFKRLPTDS